MLVGHRRRQGQVRKQGLEHKLGQGHRQGQACRRGQVRTGEQRRPRPREQTKQQSTDRKKKVAIVLFQFFIYFFIILLKMYDKILLLKKRNVQYSRKFISIRFVTFMIVVELEQLKELMLPLRIQNHFIENDFAACVSTINGRNLSVSQKSFFDVCV